MGISWYLYCVDDGEALWLGKLIKSNAARDAPVLRFWIRTVPEEMLSLAIQKFMLLHRTHELRTVTEKFFSRIEDEAHTVLFTEISDLMGAVLEPDPIDQEELIASQRVDDHAREALTRRSR